jgi:hypothetical protein
VASPVCVAICPKRLVASVMSSAPTPETPTAALYAICGCGKTRRNVPAIVTAQRETAVAELPVWRYEVAKHTAATAEARLPSSMAPLGVRRLLADTS